MLVHNDIYGLRLRRRFDADPAAFTLHLAAGDVYALRGDRSLRATLPSPTDTLRVTLLAERTYSPVRDRRADDPSAPLKLPPIHS